jgi:two-component system, response regulator YesN
MTISASPPKRHLVLAVDDEPDVLAAIVSVLEASHTVYTARSGTEARTVLAQCLPDLLILDVQLGDADGLQLLAEFRMRSAAPVLIVTGQGSEEVAGRAVRLRANDYLRKPFSPSELRERVDALLAAGPRPEHLAERARSLIDSLLRQQVSATDVADRLEVPPRQLLRVFRDRFGRTPTEYLREARLQRAQELLLATDLPIAQIASEIGFRYLSYFDRAFGREFNMSPAEFRRSHRIPAGLSPDNSSMPKV